jgi:hypothetical protein
MKLVLNLIIYCVILSVYLYLTLAINPRIWLHRMPPAVVKKVTPKNKKEKQLTVLYGLPFLIFMVGYPIYYVLKVGGSLFEIFGILLLFFIAFDLWDTLILDLLIFCTIKPRFIRINGTEKNDYSNKKYHISSGLKGIVMAIIFSVIISIILFFIRT